MGVCQLPDKPVYKMTYEGGNDNNTEEGIKIPLTGDGDFRSQECLDILDESDIVITNPPFSLFQEFTTTLINHNKKFVIVGNQNAITYKKIFQLLKDNKIWLGNKFGDMSFRVPQDSEPRPTRFWIDETGQKWRSLGNACWYTNLDIDKRHKKLILQKKYNPDKYPTYDNYDAINVNKVSEIPWDYEGIMGVPVTFLDKYNPEQFTIIGNEYTLNIDKGRGYVNGKRMYSRIFIKKKPLKIIEEEIPLNDLKEVY